MPTSTKGQKPTEVGGRRPFDKFADHASSLVSRGPFFAFCLLLVTSWLIQGVIKILTSGLHAFFDDQYQLEINTTTTIITFLMVAILQNSQTRFEQATNKKLNAIADALSDLLEHTAEGVRSKGRADHLRKDAEELRAAVGLEHREST